MIVLHPVHCLLSPCLNRNLVFGSRNRSPASIWFTQLLIDQGISCVIKNPLNVYESLYTKSLCTNLGFHHRHAVLSAVSVDLPIWYTFWFSLSGFLDSILSCICILRASKLFSCEAYRSKVFRWGITFFSHFRYKEYPASSPFSTHMIEW